MDVTELARTLLEPIPAHRTLGIQVLRSGDDSAEVALVTPPAMTNVIGSLHSSGLLALADATGLAAIIGASNTESDFDRILPLGAAASLEFLAPARGRLVASCRLDEHARHTLQPLLARREDRARISTVVEVRDEGGVLVCRGSFEWSVRRRPDSA